MSSQTKLWFIGSNIHNKCCPESSSEMHNLTISKYGEKLKTITNILAGNSFNIFMKSTKYDELAVFGYIKRCQLLLPYTTNTFYTIPSSVIFICVQFYGNNFDEYWCVGRNDYCQLGAGHNETVTDITQIKGMNNIKAIYSGSSGWNLFWITNDDEIYVNGANDYCQLGMKDKPSTVAIPSLLTSFGEKGLKCIDATSSDEYTMIVCQDGSVWSAGKSRYGENGHGADIELSDEYTKIKTLEKHKIVNTSSGQFFSLFLEDNGNVWSCGDNDNGELGLGNTDTASTRLPTKIQFFVHNKVKITKIKCGISNCIALSEKGNVYCWGDNQHAQCAVGTISLHDAEIVIPSFVAALSNECVIDIKCNSYHCGAVTKDKYYYLWGRNDYNQCCFIDKDINKVFEPYCINEYILSTTNSIDIIGIYLGFNSTMVLVKR